MGKFGKFQLVLAGTQRKASHFIVFSHSNKNNIFSRWLYMDGFLGSLNKRYTDRILIKQN